MAEIRPSSPEFADQLLALFERFDASGITRPMWQGLLNYSGGGPDYPSGFVLLADQRVVGFLGTLHSQRRIRGAAAVFCNLSSWIVDDAHRAAGFGLLRKALHRKDITVTNFSASARVEAMLKQLGFKELEDTGCFFSLAHGLSVGERPVRIIVSRAEIPPLLTGECAGYFHDHAYPHCQHLVLSTDRGDCYLVYTMRRKRNLLPYAHIHFISNREVFSIASAALARRLARMHSASGFLVERRFLEPAFQPGRFVYARRLSRLYRSTLPPADVDNLYTELPVLGM